MYDRAQSKRYTSSRFNPAIKSMVDIRDLALDMPFLLLPFRPASDPSAARTFIRNFFNEERSPLQGERLEQELMLTEPMVRRLQDSRWARLKDIGIIWRPEMVLEPNCWWCSDMGGV